MSRLRIVVAGGVALTGLAFAIAGSGAAMAGTTSGTGGVASGNQLNVPVSIPVNVCGNVVAVLGLADAACSAGATAANSAAGGATSGEGSVAGGNQISIPVTVPVSICGNAVAALGAATASCGSQPRAGTPHQARTPQKAPARHRVKPKALAPLARRASRAPVPAPPKAAALPSTGANLAVVGGGALALLGAGGTTLVATRRR